MPSLLALALLMAGAVPGAPAPSPAHAGSGAPSRTVPASPGLPTTPGLPATPGLPTTPGLPATPGLPTHPPAPTARSAVPPPGLGPHLARTLRRAPQAPTRALTRGLSPAALAAAGATVEATLGPVSAILLPDAATALRLAQGGAVLEHPGPLHPALDLSRTYVHADRTDFADGFAERLRGQGVLIGAYDSGLDLGHPDFRLLDGRSRAVAVWDQDTQVTCDTTRIAAGRCPAGDVFGHGTHVTSIAAGSGPRYRGIAPDADLIMVRSSAFDGLVRALGFMANQALGRAAPLVVNISLGGHVGAHDGTSLDCQAIDAFPHLVVVAAGNEGGTPVHAGAELAGGPAEVALRLGLSDTATHTRAIVDVWGAPTASITAALIAVRAGQIVWTSPAIGVGGAGRTEVIRAPSGALGTVDLDAESTLSPLNGRPHLALFVDVHTLDEDTVLALQVRGRGRFDAWIDAPADEAILPRFARARALGLSTEVTGDDHLSISDLATAAQALAVSALVSRNELTGADGNVTRVGGSLGSLAGFSSYGPTLDPARTGPKPDLAAPGQLIIAAATRTADPDAGLYRVLSGTSMAVPHVSGAAAVLLGARPTATRADLRRWLLDSAAVPPDDDTRWGAGALDVAAAAEAAGVATTGCGCEVIDTATPVPLTVPLLVASFWLAGRRRRPRS